MRIEHLEFLLEEESMQAVLESLLRGMLPSDVTWNLHPLGGRPKMYDRLQHRLKGYSHRLPKTWLIVVMEDQNGRDCHKVKAQLEEFARRANLPTRTNPYAGRFHVINRIVVPCLEAWYFGDWEAVRAAYPRVPEDIPHKPRYRNPDAIPEPTWRLLYILQQAGYLPKSLKELPKVTVAKTIAPHMVPTRNRSHSFQVFYHTLQSIFEE